jgi:large subunit ribosomal protein L30e
MVKAIERVVKDAIINNKYKSGIREVLRTVKGSKLIIISRSVNSDDKAKLEEQAGSSNVPIYQFDGNSVQLGKLCNKAFRVTAISLRSGTDTEINSILAEQIKNKQNK